MNSRPVPPQASTDPPAVSAAEMAAVDALAVARGLTLPKHGLLTESGKNVAGRLALGDIGIPPAWIAAAVQRFEPGGWYPDGDLTWLSGGSLD